MNEVSHIPNVGPIELNIRQNTGGHYDISLAPSVTLHVGPTSNIAALKTPKMGQNGSKVEKSDFDASLKEKMYCMPTHRLKWQPENHRGAFRPLDSKYGYSSGLERSKNEPKMAKNSPNYGTILKNEKK